MGFLIILPKRGRARSLHYAVYLITEIITFLCILAETPPHSERMNSNVTQFCVTTCQQYMSAAKQGSVPIQEHRLPERDGSGLTTYLTEHLETGNFYFSLWLY